MNNNPLSWIDPLGLDAFSDQGLSDSILNAAGNQSAMAADYAAMNNLNNSDSSGGNNPNGSRSSPCSGSRGSGKNLPMFGGPFQAGLALNGQLGPINANWNVGLAIDEQGNLAVYDTPGFGGGVHPGSLYLDSWRPRSFRMK